MTTNSMLKAPLDKIPRGTATCQLAGVPVVLDMSGALFIPSANLLVVADLHLEKGTSGARRGLFLPPYDSQLTLSNLSNAVAKFAPAKLILLGDSFHDHHAPHRLSQDSSHVLHAIGQACELIWVTGNHDPQIPRFISDTSVTDVHFDGIQFTHIPQGGEVTAQVCGHLHPAAVVKSRGRTLRRRCFVTDGARLILPAFGAYTGGLNINDNAFDGLFKLENRITHIIGDQAIFTLPAPVRKR